MVILALVALAAVGAYRALGDGVAERVDCAARAIAGGAACAPSATRDVQDDDRRGVSSGRASAALHRIDALGDSMVFEAMSGGDGIVDRSDLDRAAAAGNRLAALLLESDSLRHAFDVGAGEGDVDEKISLDDVRAFLQDAASSDDLREVLADTAAGRGGRDGDISRDDFDALANDASMSRTVREWARHERDTRRFDDCDGLLCAAGDIAGAIGEGGSWLARAAQRTAWTAGIPLVLPGQLDDFFEFETHLPLGVASFAKGTIEGLVGLGSALVERQTGAWSALLEGDVGRFVEVQSGADLVRGLIEHPGAVADTAVAIAGRYADLATTFATGDPDDAGRAAGELGSEVAITVLTAGAGRAAIESRALADGAATVARTGDELAVAMGDAANGARSARAAGGLCFAGGTEVHTARGEVPIEDVQLGRRVSTIGDRGAATAVRAGTWRRVDVEMLDPSGSGDTVQIELLRPLDWIASIGAAPGARIAFELPEMGLAGDALVTAVGDAPAIESGAGRVVLARVTSTSRSLLELRFEGSDTVLALTARHALYSLDRDAWVRASELRPGERLRRAAGAAVIASIEPVSGARRVYNLEVETEHSYLVSPLAILSHNDNPCAAAIREGNMVLERDGVTLTVPLEAADGTRPTVLVAPGFGARGRSYTNLTAGLVDDGYAPAVLDVPHRFESHLAPRVSHARSALDMLEDAAAAGGPLDGQLDLARLGAVGHSMGGATVAGLVATDAERVAAGVALAPGVSPVGSMLAYGPDVRSPLLVVGARLDGIVPPHFYARKLARACPDGLCRYVELPWAEHMGFADTPSVLGLDRIPRGLAMPGRAQVEAARRLAVDWLDRFVR